MTHTRTILGIVICPKIITVTDGTTDHQVLCRAYYRASDGQYLGCRIISVFS